MGTHAHLNRGRWAEDSARQYLAKRGLVTVERNYRSRFGELDLIMRDREELVFVEVRFRRRRDYGGGLESVDTAKQRRLRLVAQQFLQDRAVAATQACRFDVVAITLEADRPQIDWVHDAF